MRLKEMHYVMYAEDFGIQSPFGSDYTHDFPTELFLKEFFNEQHQEFPGYDYFSFEYEEKYGRCGTSTVQWYLVGNNNENGDNNNGNNNNGESNND